MDDRCISTHTVSISPNMHPWFHISSINTLLSDTDTLLSAPQWGAADAEIKVPSNENTELKRSPFKAWSRSVYSHTCYA